MQHYQDKLRDAGRSGNLIAVTAAGGLKAGRDTVYAIVIEIPRLFFRHFKADYETWRARRRPPPDALA